MFEEKGTLVVRTELPGIEKEEIEVSVDGDFLTIRGQKESDDTIEETNYLRRERTSGSYFRRIHLPEGVQPAKAKASFNNSVLDIRIPKDPEMKKSINVPVK